MFIKPESILEPEKVNSIGFMIPAIAFSYENR